MSEQPDLFGAFASEEITHAARRESHKTFKAFQASERDKLILAALAREPATAQELSRSLFEQGLVPSPERNSVHPSLTRMMQHGRVEVIGRKYDRATRRRVSVYALPAREGSH